jgi:hypothetical protein
MVFVFVLKKYVAGLQIKMKRKHVFLARRIRHIPNDMGGLKNLENT